MASKQAMAIFALASMFHLLHAITIVRGPVDKMVIEGDTVDLQCIVENKGNVLVHWLRENQYLTFDYKFYEEEINPRYSVIHNGNQNSEFTLRINNVQISDAGRYQCGHYQPIPSFRSSRLSVTKAPSLPQEQPVSPDEGSPRCSVTPQNAGLDRTVTLTCVSEGGNPAARLTWLQDGRGAITGESESRNTVDRNLVGDLNGVRFRCRLNHATLPQPKFCSVTPLMIQPTVRIEPPRVIARVGQGALFTCAANGIPDISMYQFFFNDVEVEKQPDPNRFSVSGDFRQLQIRNVVAEDNGAIIRCDVSIPSGLTNYATAQLLVESAMNVTDTPMTTMITSNTTGDPIRYVGRITRYGFNTIIIVFGSLVGMILMVLLVYIMHRCFTGKRVEKDKMMKMEWKGVTKSQRRAQEIIPNLSNPNTAARRYTQLETGDVGHPRYQDLNHPRYQDMPSNAAVPGSPLNDDSMDVGVYEGVATTSAHVEAHIPSSPSPRSSPARTPKVSVSDSPKHPPPRASPVPGSPRDLGEGTSTIPASRPPAALPNSPGGARVPPSAFQENSRAPQGHENGVYSRPTSNALSTEETFSYQGSVINHLEEESNYDEPPIEYSQPESDAVYEVPPDGYVLPDPRNIEDPDLEDDYELPPTEDQLGYVQV